MIILPEGYRIGKYTVKFFIKEGLYNGTYKIEDENGSPLFMKFYDLSKVPEKLIIDGDIEEIINCRKIRHENVISYVDDGSITIDGAEYKYLVTNYFIGRLLSEIINEGKVFTEDTAKGIMAQVLTGLHYLNGEHYLNHNDLTPRNIILDEVEPDKYIPRIIDLGHVHHPISSGAPFPINDLTLTYCAPESLAGIFGPKVDVFSAMVILYQMLAGKAPWPCELSDNDHPQIRKQKIRQARKSPLDIAALKEKGVSDSLITFIEQGLALDFEQRPDLATILDCLNGNVQNFPRKEDRGGDSQSRLRSDESRTPHEERTVSVEFQKSSEKSGGGFADIAGMEQLKDDLMKRVIWVLKDREKAERYRLTPPNGMILYGPPGCGKTFFAEKFAEESNFNFTIVNGSDLGSSYLHGTQGKIAALFEKAQKNAPSIICFDEFDSFVPSRSTMAAEHRPEEINEFLSQLNNCSKKGIFVIGTTNRIDMIDPAVLRRGRMDLHIEIPAPDERTREEIFKIHLKGRPVADDINYQELAQLTDNYASSDIAFIVNESAMMAALADIPIGQQQLVNSIKSNPSSLGGPKENRKRIGFK